MLHTIPKKVNLSHNSTSSTQMITWSFLLDILCDAWSRLEVQKTWLLPLDTLWNFPSSILPGDEMSWLLDVVFWTQWYWNTQSSTFQGSTSRSLNKNPSLWCDCIALDCRHVGWTHVPAFYTCQSLIVPLCHDLTQNCGSLSRNWHCANSWSDGWRQSSQRSKQPDRKE